MDMPDLFDGKARPAPTAREHRRQRKSAVARGYAAQPGTGPAGESCKTCVHLARQRFAKTYLKCALMRAVWTGGSGTDVKARSPACRRWRARTETETAD